MDKRRLTLIAVALLALLLFGMGPLLAKKPVKPPPPPPPSTDPDPAIAYRTTVRELWVMNADGTNRTRVLQLDGTKLGRPDWSPPGWSPPTGWPQSDLPYLVFWSDVQGPGIYVIRLDGEDLRKVTTTTAWSTTIDSRPVWSPKPVPGVGDDRYRIACVDDAYGDEPEIFIVNVDGSDRTTLTVAADFPEVPTWSPDAGKLLVSLIDQDGDQYAVFDFGAGTSTIHRHAGPLLGHWIQSPEWAKTQSKIVWSDLWDIWIVDLDDPANPVRLTDNRKIYTRSPSWSPDDSQIVYMELGQSKGKNPASKEIAIVNASDGSDRQVILDLGAHPAWRRK